MNQSLARTLKLLGVMVLGAVVPQAHTLQFLIRYAILAMLWIAFLDMKPSRVRREHLFVLLAQWAIGLCAWAAFARFNHQLALTALLIGITPTATAAPVITGMLRGRVEFVAGSVLITNVATGIMLPLALRGLPGIDLQKGTSVLPLVLQTAGVVLVPLILAQGMRAILPNVTKGILRYRQASFYLWLVVLFLATSNASYFIQNSVKDWTLAAAPAVLAILLCGVNFWVGGKIGAATGLRQECSQSLGQKNTIFTIWAALTFVNPFVALGPTFYVLCHNTYNAWQLARLSSRRRQIPPTPVSELAGDELA
jgi:BASS family bile acid:Na+ symporter